VDTTDTQTVQVHRSTSMTRSNLSIGGGFPGATRTGRGESRPATSTDRCYNCNIPGHFAKDCRKRSSLRSGGQQRGRGRPSQRGQKKSYRAPQHHSRQTGMYNIETALTERDLSDWAEPDPSLSGNCESRV
jgi:hypothetical protein